nr:hypothetical protein [uncultured Limosilactobacillus sp.]
MKRTTYGFRNFLTLVSEFFSHYQSSGTSCLANLFYFLSALLDEKPLIKTKNILISIIKNEISILLIY